MFFQDTWDHSIKPHIQKETAEKVKFTGESWHPELLGRVDIKTFPVLYGGQCQCKVGCINSDKGPWTTTPNTTINYQ